MVDALCFILLVLSGIYLFIVARPRSAEERKIMKRKEEVIELLDSGMDWNTIRLIKYIESECECAKTDDRGVSK